MPSSYFFHSVNSTIIRSRDQNIVQSLEIRIESVLITQITHKDEAVAIALGHRRARVKSKEQ